MNRQNKQLGITKKPTKGELALRAGRGQPTSLPDPDCKTCGGDGLQRVTVMYPPSEDHYCYCRYR